MTNFQLVMNTIMANEISDGACAKGVLQINTLCRLFANCLCVMVHGRWWWPWNAAI